MSHLTSDGVRFKAAFRILRRVVFAFAGHGRMPTRKEITEARLVMRPIVAKSNRECPLAPPFTPYRHDPLGHLLEVYALSEIVNDDLERRMVFNLSASQPPAPTFH